MKVNSLVCCVLGHPGVLEQDQIYTVREVTSQGNINVFEAEPPHPHSSFYRERFVEVQSPDEIPGILSEVLFDQIEN
jgi:hypothetical protein